ncbi:lytic polysaccharide monooxygenase [Pandoraea sp.]|uniref:lytic polysaccharide monooxygenase n=1 Tax=Pandoraea sp. TaxID=1883445 RepID=UPI0025DDB815|nr:lytic polysaccharide monooxygenase [Pandoraea sp.]
MKRNNAFNRTVLALTAAALLAPQLAAAHGSMASPGSRVYQCWKDASSPGCQEMKSISGEVPTSNWSGVAFMNNGMQNNDSVALSIAEHMKATPDGEICSGGRTDMKGINHLKGGWPTTVVSPNAAGNIDFHWKATAPHRTFYMATYITKDNYDPSKPVKWSDLEELCIVDGKSQEASSQWLTKPAHDMHWQCAYPKNKEGRHLMLTIWQRPHPGHAYGPVWGESTESFYSCSDVVMNGTVASYKDLGQLTAKPAALKAGMQVEFRLMDKTGADRERGMHVLASERDTEADSWVYDLATKVNQKSQLVRIGVRQDSGKVEPSLKAAENKVYSIDGKSEFNFNIDIGVTRQGSAKTYKAGDQYKIGDVVIHQGRKYECYQYANWCSTAHVEHVPGSGAHAKQFWRDVGVADQQKPGQEDKKPGNEDKKPGNENQKPGNENRKPGNENQKPGNETEKPAIEAIVQLHGQAAMTVGETQAIAFGVSGELKHDIKATWSVKGPAGETSHTDNVLRFAPTVAGKYDVSVHVTGMNGTQKAFGKASMTVVVKAKAIEQKPEQNKKPGNDNHPAYKSGTQYKVGDVVRARDGGLYKCKVFGWCGQPGTDAHYEPGKGASWNLAWEKVGA